MAEVCIDLFDMNKLYNWTIYAILFNKIQINFDAHFKWQTEHRTKCSETFANYISWNLSAVSEKKIIENAVHKI